MVGKICLEKVPIVLDENAQVLEIKIKQLRVSSHAYPLIFSLLFLSRINDIGNTVRYVEFIEVFIAVGLDAHLLDKQPHVVLYGV